MGGKKGKKKSKKKKSYTKAQQMAKKRIAAGKTISSVKAANKSSMQKKAADRHAKFKQTKVQTFGGKKTSFSKAEQKRITDAGYSVAGYSKAPAQSNTQLQVNKDNQMYGNTFPSGAIGISEEGKALAAQQKAEAAAKKAAEAAAAKKEATRKSTFDAGRLKGGILTQSSAAFADTFAKPKYMYQGNFAGRIPGLSNYFSPDAGAAATYSRSGMFKGIPFAGGSSTGTLTKFKVPDGAKIGRSPLGIRQFKLNPKQMTQLGKGITVAGDDVAKVAAKGLGKYGARAVPFVGAGLSLADSFNRVREGDYTGAALAAGSAIPGPVGWASLAGLAAKDISSAINTKETKTASVDAGGLNIASTGGVDSGDAPQSNVGRVLTFGKNLVQQPKAALAYGSDVAKQLLTPKLADGTLTGNMDFAGNLPGDKGFDNRDVQIKSAVNNAMDSKFVQQYGENLGLPKNFKAQTKDALAALGENYKGATADRDGIYEGTSKTLKNLSSDKRLAPIAKYLNQLGTDNENVTDADRNKKFSMMGFQTPFTNEMAADAITAFQPNVEGMAGLSKADRGLIQGSGGNRIISGKLTDIAREAITGNIGTGDSLGIQKGTPLTIGNMLDAGSTIASNLQQDGTLASKRSAEIANLANQAGKITTPSLIKGLIPKFGGSGSFRPNAVSSLGQGATTLAAATPTSVEEVLPLPTTATQTGTESGNLASIMQNAYQNQMSLYGMNPNYAANFRQPRFNRPRKRFRQVFNRGYF